MGVQKPKGERDETARMCVWKREAASQEGGGKLCVCTPSDRSVPVRGSRMSDSVSRRNNEMRREQERAAGERERETVAHTRANARLPHIPAAQLAAVESRPRSC